jgi:hypothetical protein
MDRKVDKRTATHGRFSCDVQEAGKHTSRSTVSRVRLEESLYVRRLCIILYSYV